MKSVDLMIHYVTSCDLWCISHYTYLLGSVADRIRSTNFSRRGKYSINWATTAASWRPADVLPLISTINKFVFDIKIDEEKRNRAYKGDELFWSQKYVKRDFFYIHDGKTNVSICFTNQININYNVKTHFMPSQSIEIFKRQNWHFRYDIYCLKIILEWIYVFSNDLFILYETL